MLQPIAALRAARPRGTRSLRRPLLALVALAAPVAGAAPALAGPSSGPTGGNVFTVGRGWGPTGGMSASAAEQSVRAEPASVHGAYGTDDLGALGYCEPYGPNVVITGFTYDVVRWHGTASAAAVEAGGGTDAGSPMVVSVADGAFAPGLRTTQVASGL